MINAVVLSNGIYLTPEHVGKHFVRSDDRHAWPPKVNNLERTIQGTVMPFKELQRTPEFTRKHGTKIHSESARLGETFAACACSLSDFGAYFDSMAVCYPKQL
jgi:threonine aldolase